MNTKHQEEAENTSDNRIRSPLPQNVRLYTELGSNGRLVSRSLTAYECQLEDDVQQLQEALFTISSQYAKIQFRLRQISSATASERNFLLNDLVAMAAQGLDERDGRQVGELPSLRCDSSTLGNVRAKQQKIISQLRERLESLADATGTCFQADTNKWSNASPADQDNGKYMHEGKPRERYLQETWSGGDYDKQDIQCVNSKWKLKAPRGRPKNADKKERGETECSEHEFSTNASLKKMSPHSEQLHSEDILLTLKTKRKSRKPTAFRNYSYRHLAADQY